MATKSYTDIPQSETLSKILSPESADMYYPNRTDIQYQGALPIGMKHGNRLLSQEIPCWSLAALLNVLPEYSIQRTDWYYKIEHKIVITTNKDNYASKNYDNPVDACVEMIIKLHEQNLL
ncbi:MAG: hypothetical protein PUC18_12995 [Prevotellaceae bacterium]|nr:hypothetical protein [Prevotellaceae bacterium]